MRLKIALLMVILIAWLVPFYWAGSMRSVTVPLYPRLAFQYTAAGLFTRRVSSWNQTLIQVQSKGAADWKTIDTAELSPMGAFGFRQRLDRVLLDTQGKQTAKLVQQRLAEWTAREYAKLHANEGEVIGVRMGQTTWASNTPEMAMPAGE